MNKTDDEEDMHELSLDELDEVNGGKGIFESVGGYFGGDKWAAAGKAFDITSTLTVGSIPVYGQAYAFAQGAVDTLTTAMDPSKTWGQVGVAAVGMAAALIPAGKALEAIGAEGQAAEYGVGQLIGAVTTGGQLIGDHLLEKGEQHDPTDTPHDPETPPAQDAHPDNPSADNPDNDPGHVDTPAHDDTPHDDTPQDAHAPEYDNTNGDHGPVDDTHAADATHDSPSEGNHDTPHDDPNNPDGDPGYGANSGTGQTEYDNGAQDHTGDAVASGGGYDNGGTQWAGGDGGDGGYFGGVGDFGGGSDFA